jgi:hypothetical protein
VFLPEPLNTHGTEIAPGSDVVGKDLEDEGFGHRKAFKTESVDSQCRAQDPGPPGWPQLPQGPAARGAGSGPPADVANTESFFSSSVEWQLGQSGTVLERTRVSNSWPQDLQAYS